LGLPYLHRGVPVRHCYDICGANGKKILITISHAKRMKRVAEKQKMGFNLKNILTELFFN
jgi:hypothetical protein